MHSQIRTENEPVSHSSFWFWAITLFVVSFGLRWAMLTQSPIASGTDGYYYTEQVRFFVAHGRFRSFENSLVVVFFGFIQWLLGDPVRAVKLGVSILAGLTAPAGFFYVLMSRKGFRSALWLGALLAVSPSLSYLCAHFPKTSGAIPFLFLSLGLMERGFSVPSLRKKRRALVFSAFFFLILIFTHKLVFLIGGWVAAGTLLDHTNFRSLFYRWRVGLLCFVFIGVGLLGKVFLPSDIFRILPAWNGPQGWPPYILSERVFFHPVLHVEIILSCLAVGPALFLLNPDFAIGVRTKTKKAEAVSTKKVKVLLVAWTNFLRKKMSGLLHRIPRSNAKSGLKRVSEFHYRTLAWILLIPVLLNPFLNYRDLDLGYRLVLTVFLPGTVLWSWGAPTKWLGLLTGLGICLGGGIFTGKVYNPQFDERNVTAWHEVIDRMPEKRFPLVLCHLGLNYYYTWVTGKDTLAFRPDDREYPPNQTWRISWGVSRTAFEDILGPCYKKNLPAPQLLTPTYALVREDVWRLYVSKLPPSGFLISVANSWRNPHKVRPLFLTHRKSRNHTRLTSPDQ